eukprot:TRINITY_DN61270_c0_g1_i1.p1 TRINITY_DN61270_c0_g1~~TRINITY_DN61270_c0_g1_i1.p1  ORF type:complete len:1732 (-),score=164.78 TRINITY_DN61270_c0_g1_i1:162-4616(-)
MEKYRQGRRAVCGPPSPEACMYKGKVFCPYDNECHDNCYRCPKYKFDDSEGSCTDDCSKTGLFLCPSGVHKKCVPTCGAMCKGFHLDNHLEHVCEKATPDTCADRFMFYCTESIKCVYSCYDSCTASPHDPTLTTIGNSNSCQHAQQDGARFNPCILGQCYNGGTCVKLPNWTTCLCPDGYSGPGCNNFDLEYAPQVGEVVGGEEGSPDQRFPIGQSQPGNVIHDATDPFVGQQDAVPEDGPAHCDNEQFGPYCPPYGGCLKKGLTCNDCHDSPLLVDRVCMKPTPTSCRYFDDVYCPGDATCVGSCRNCRGFEVQPGGLDGLTCIKPGERLAPRTTCADSSQYYCEMLDECVDSCCKDCVGKKDGRKMSFPVGDGGRCTAGADNIDFISARADLAHFAMALNSLGATESFRCAESIMVPKERLDWSDGFVDFIIAFHLVDVPSDDELVEGPVKRQVFSDVEADSFVVEFSKFGNRIHAEVVGSSETRSIIFRNLESDVGTINVLDSALMPPGCIRTPGQKWCPLLRSCVDNCCEQCHSGAIINADNGIFLSNYYENELSRAHQKYPTCVSATPVGDISNIVSSDMYNALFGKLSPDDVPRCNVAIFVPTLAVWDSLAAEGIPLQRYLEKHPMEAKNFGGNHYVATEQYGGGPLLEDKMLNLGEVEATNGHRLRIWKDEVTGLTIVQGESHWQTRRAAIVDSIQYDHGSVYVIDQLLWPRDRTACTPDNWFDCPRMHACIPIYLGENVDNCWCELDGAPNLVSAAYELQNLDPSRCTPHSGCMHHCHPVQSLTSDFKRMPSDSADSACFQMYQGGATASAADCETACVNAPELHFEMPDFNQNCVGYAWSSTTACVLMFNYRGGNQDCLEHLDPTAWEVYSRVTWPREHDNDQYLPISEHFTKPVATAERPAWPERGCDWTVEDWCPHLQKCVTSCCRHCVASENPLDPNYLHGLRTYRFHDNQCELGDDNWDIVQNEPSLSRTAAVVQVVYDNYPEMREEIRCGGFFPPSNSAFDTYPGYWQALLTNPDLAYWWITHHTTWRPSWWEERGDSSEQTILYERGARIYYDDAFSYPYTFSNLDRPDPLSSAPSAFYTSAGSVSNQNAPAVMGEGATARMAINPFFVIAQPRELDVPEWGHVFEVDQFLSSYMTKPQGDFLPCRTAVDCWDIQDSHNTLAISVSYSCEPIDLTNQGVGGNCRCDVRGSTCNPSNDVCAKQCMTTVGWPASLLTIQATSCDYPQYYCPNGGGSCVANCASCTGNVRSLDSAHGFDAGVGRYVESKLCIPADPAYCRSLGGNSYYCGATGGCLTGVSNPCGSCGSNTIEYTTTTVAFCRQDADPDVNNEVARNCGNSACLTNTNSNYCVTSCASSCGSHTATDNDGAGINFCVTASPEYCAANGGQRYCASSRTCVPNCNSCSGMNRELGQQGSGICVACDTIGNPSNGVCDAAEGSFFGGMFCLDCAIAAKWPGSAGGAWQKSETVF